MTHVSLFTGIGGLDLAAEWAGFETVLQVEREPFALEVLAKHWPDVPRITDVRDVNYERVQQIMADSVRGRCNSVENETAGARKAFGDGQANNVGVSGFTTGEDNESARSGTDVTVVSGGFPCQPFSSAGKRRGVEDDRYLWPELLRIVEELQPAWVVGENVSGLLSIDGGMEIDRMLAALEARDYTPWILHYPAAGVGAPHKRDRVFIVGSSESLRGRDIQRREWERQAEWIKNTSEDVADTNKPRVEGRQGAGDISSIGTRKDKQSERCAYSIGTTWQSEPDVGRVANGVSNRVDRLRALGNAVVPQQAYPIFAAIARMES